MSRREGLKRGLFALVYLPLYYLLLYPVVFFAGVIVVIIDIAWQIVTGRSLERKPLWTSTAWQRISQPVTWVFSGNNADKPGWIP